MTNFASLFTGLLAATLAVAAPLSATIPSNSPSGKLHTFDILYADDPNAIPNTYIASFRNDLEDDRYEMALASFSSTIMKRNLNKRDASGNILSREVHSYNINKWRAMLFSATDDTLDELLTNNTDIDFIEADRISTINTIAQTNAPWGLERLSHAKAGEKNYLFDSSAGEGITAYVVDTGVKTSHIEFEGRATWGGNFVDNIDDDENGHGSHVAGTIAGATYGVAKKANIIAVKVLDANGGGANSGVIAGMQFVIEHVEKNNLKGKAVMNMSLGGDKSESINAAIEEIYRAGIVPVVAAGNNATDAKNSSPASSENAITVGATDKDDNLASFSNFGSVVDINAPGDQILSVGIKSDDDTAILSGTSMASPHVCGLAAYLMALEGITDVDAVATRIKELGTASGATVLNNKQGNSQLIANNGNL